jgi:hypothetical protein
MLRLYVSCATSVLHACQAGVSEKKINRLSRNAQSQRALTMEGDAAKRWRNLAGWIADGPRGEGFGPGSLVGPGSVEVKRTRLVFSTRGRSWNCQADFRDGGACRTPRNVSLREPFLSLSTADSLSLTPPSA